MSLAGAVRLKKNLKAAHMAKKPEKETVGSGLELDKINLSSLASGSARNPTRVKDPGVGAKGSASGGLGPRPEAENMPQNKKKSNMALILFLAILALLMAFTAFFKQKDLTFRLLPGESGTSLENHLRVGPVTATLANEDIVKFSIDIECGNADLKEKLAEKDTQIRDEIVAVLTAPGTEELIKRRDFETIKAMIKENLGDLGQDAIKEIYFAELLLY